MNEQNLLLQSIIANRDEDTPRLVYADWLDDHDLDPGQSDFIRGQVLGTIPEQVLHVRIAEMTMRRGFVNVVRCPAARWVNQLAFELFWCPREWTVNPFYTDVNHWIDFCCQVRKPFLKECPDTVQPLEKVILEHCSRQLFDPHHPFQGLIDLCYEIDGHHDEGGPQWIQSVRTALCYQFPGVQFEVRW